MAQGMRPGGLTALAVVNFVFSGIGLLGAVGLIFTMTFLADEDFDSGDAESGASAKESPGADGTEKGAEGPDGDAAKDKRESPAVAANREQMRVFKENRGKVFVQAGLSLVEAVLMFLAGLGFLGQKRVMGRYVGTIAAIIGLASVAFQLTYLPFGLEHMSSIIYPLLVLVLLNTTFRHDLVN